MTLVYRSLFAVLLFVAASFAVAADDYRFPTRRAERGETLAPSATYIPSVAEVIRGQAPSTLPLSSSSMPSLTPATATGNALGSVEKATPRNDIVDSELSMRPPDPVGLVDPATIPEVLRPLPPPSSDKTLPPSDKSREQSETASATPSTAWNTMLLIVALATGGLAAYAIFAALDYKQRWEHAILAQNDRLIGAFESDDPIAMPQAW